MCLSQESSAQREREALWHQGCRRLIAASGNCGLALRFHGDFDLRPQFEADSLAVIGRQHVVDAYLSIQMIGAFKGI